MLWHSRDILLFLPRLCLPSRRPPFVLRWRARLLYVREEMPQQIFNVFVPTFAKAKSVIYAATNYRLKLLIPYARRSTANNSFFLIKSALGPRVPARHGWWSFGRNHLLDFALAEVIIEILNIYQLCEFFTNQKIIYPSHEQILKQFISRLGASTRSLNNSIKWWPIFGVFGVQIYRTHLKMETKLTGLRRMPPKMVRTL